MENRTVNFPNKKMLVQLNKIRGCQTCTDKKGCEKYEFAKDATEALIKENGFENSFMGQILAQSLSWAVADEALLSGMVHEEDEEFYYEDELHPLFYALESVRDHIRDMMRLVLEVKKSEKD